MRIYTLTPAERKLGYEWHGGQGFMLYAAASVGTLTTGPEAYRSRHTDSEWAAELVDRLMVELREVETAALGTDDPDCLPDAPIAAAWLAKLAPIAADLANGEAWLIEMMTAYVDAMLWASTDTRPGEDEPRPLDDDYGPADVAPIAMAEIRRTCRDFATANRADLDAIGADWAQHGHDLFLTREHHGVGYWDRGYGEVGDRLTVAAEALGSAEPYVGDDGKVYAS